MSHAKVKLSFHEDEGTAYGIGARKEEGVDSIFLCLLQVDREL